MSNIFYPLGLITNQKVTPVNSVITDQFEDGGSAARRLWPAQFFTRKFEFDHQNLTLAEWQVLRGFQSQRSGGYDAFWYRDNINRAGNALVRFASPVPAQWNGFTHSPSVSLNEVTPIRSLVEPDEVTVAAGVAPLAWFDANRELYLSHAGQIVKESAAYDAFSQTYPAPWQLGSLNLGGVTSQYQTYDFAADRRAATSAILPIPSGQPALTLFAIIKAPASATAQTVFGVGNYGPTQFAGLKLDADNYFKPILGGSETWATAKVLNSTNYQSVALSWPASSNVASICLNGGAAITESNPRAFFPAYLWLGGHPSAAFDFTGSLANILVFASSAVNVANLHALFQHQYNLP